MGTQTKLKYVVCDLTGKLDSKPFTTMSGAEWWVEHLTIWNPDSRFIIEVIGECEGGCGRFEKLGKRIPCNETDYSWLCQACYENAN